MTTGRLPLGPLPLPKKHCIDCGVALGRTRIQKKCNKCFIAMGPNKISKEDKCKYCDQGSPARFAGNGVWRHEIKGSLSPLIWITCTKNQKKSDIKLKLFQALISFNGPDDGPIPNIEITLLDTNERAAGWTVTNILEKDGYDITEMELHIKEIKGPFEAGYVISRYGR